MPGVKYGSPTTSFPRCATSTTTALAQRAQAGRRRGAQTPQEAADREARARRAEQQAEAEQDERVERERDACAS